MIKLRDGRLCLTYGYRPLPFGIRALSEDGSQTWGKVIHRATTAAARIWVTRARSSAPDAPS